MELAKLRTDALEVDKRAVSDASTSEWCGVPTVWENSTPTYQWTTRTLANSSQYHHNQSTIPTTAYPSDEAHSPSQLDNGSQLLNVSNWTILDCSMTLRIRTPRSWPGVCRGGDIAHVVEIVESKHWRRDRDSRSSRGLASRDRRSIIYSFKLFHTRNREILTNSTFEFSEW